MALSALSDGGKLYDPYYRTDLLRRSRPSSSSLPPSSSSWYDDFSVSEYLHIYTPQSVVLTSANILESRARASPTSIALKLSDAEAAAAVHQEAQKKPEQHAMPPWPSPPDADIPQEMISENPPSKEIISENPPSKA